MQEFSSISVSSYEAGSLADRLTEQSRDGWSVVAIVPTGSTVTAYLSRTGDAASEPAPSTASEAGSFADTTSGDHEPTLAALVPDPVDTPAAEPAAEPVAEPAASVPVESTATPTTTTESTTDAISTAETASDAAAASAAATSTSTEAAGSAPAGWYADPSGRFELRYWDGGQWTEHVSRAGQQYTDPPVA